MGLEADPSCCPHPAALSRECLSPPHLPHMVSDAPVGHHLQGVQGHLLGPRAILS